MYEYRVTLRLSRDNRTKDTSDYVHAENEAEAMAKAIKYCLPIYSSANPVILGVKRTRRLKRVLNQWV